MAVNQAEFRFQNHALSVPARSTLGAWLCREPVGCRTGEILSWRNPAHPGYPYSEAAALWVMWAVWRAERGEHAPSKDTVQATVDNLTRTLFNERGAGRDGAVYLFDTALLLAALARWNRHTGDLPESDRIIDEAVNILSGFVDSTPVRPGYTSPDSWSSRWGGHLLRASAFLGETALIFNDSRLTAVADSIDTMVAAESLSSRYCHALAYHAEGLVMRDDFVRAIPLVNLLESIQRQDGSVPAWTDGTGPARLDVTAQFVRLLAALNRYGSSMNDALDFLRRCQDASGGLPYEPDSLDLNTWVGIFSDQAVAWAIDGYDGSWI